MRKFSFPVWLLLLPLMVGCASTGSKAQLGQHSYEFNKEIVKVVSADYQLFLPADYESGEKEWPLIFFLHGAGERGDDIEKVTVHGPPKIVKDNPDCEFIILSPQCPEKQWWDTETLINLLDEIVSNYSIDENRIYLTGLSMGGYGTWKLASDYPDRFAAIAPICGGGSAPVISLRIAHLPIWVFHGAKDSVVPIRESEQIVEALKKRGANVRFTVYPEAGHDSWTETYENPELYDWLLAHQRIGQ